MKQTAIEWLIEKLDNNLDINHSWRTRQYIEQAKEMEKRQKIEFAKHCLNKAKDLDVLTSFMNVEQYYNETYKSE